MVFKCKMCDASLNIQEGDKITTCEYCGTTQTVPQINSERVANLYNRADHYRKNNEFDKALALYEEILNECPTDAEAYWSIILCQYGIEYVEEGGKHIPTVNRMQVTSIFDDQNYKAALKYATPEQSVVYQEEARKIQIVKSAISTLSFSELEAITHIFEEMEGMEGLLVASKIADRVGITRSVIVNALRKFESAGVIESRSSGMKGTYIKVINEVVFEELEKLKKMK